MRYRPRRRNRMWVCLVILIALLMGVAFVGLDNSLRPLIQSYGYMAARRGAMLAVHSGVEQVIAAQEFAYTDLIAVTRNEQGQVLSAESNVTAINRLKAAATNAVMWELSKRETQTVSIPLGDLIGGSLFTGRGPFLPVDIHTSGAVISDLSSEFGDAGINQTNHRILLNMTVMMTAALPLERMNLELKTTFLVCETVLVGEVPQTVLQLDLGDGLRNIFGSND